MIGVLVAYGGGARDMDTLDAHVWKAADQVPRLIECANVAAANSRLALRVMLQLRDGAPRARIAAWHIVVSPRRAVTKAKDAARIIDAVVAEFGAARHPRLTWLHAEKPRHKPGGAPTHLHIVLGHVGPALQALDMRNGVCRLEKVMRVLEAAFGEELTCGRHHTAVVAALRRDDRGAIADRLVAAHGTHPDRPRARMTAGMRAAATRAGFDLARLVAAIEKRWAAAPPGTERAQAFLAALRVLHVRAEPGRVRGRVALYRGATFVGALHRLIGADAAVVAAQIVQNHGDHDGRHTDPTARAAEAGQTDAPRDDGRRLAAGADARSGPSGGVDLRGDPGDPGGRGGERRHGGRPDADPRPVRAGGNPAADRGRPGAGRTAFGQAFLLLIARALREDPRPRILPEARLLTLAGRIAAGERLAARLGFHLARARAAEAAILPTLPDSYTTAPLSPRRAGEGVRSVGIRQAPSGPADLPVAPYGRASAPIITDRLAGVEAAVNASSEQESQRALRTRERAGAAMDGTLSTPTRDTAAAAQARHAGRLARIARIARIARRRETLEAALHLLAADDLWPARGIKALLREVEHRRRAAASAAHACPEAATMSEDAAPPSPRM